MGRRLPVKNITHPPQQRTTEDVLAEIRRLYFKTSRGTIDRDFDRAVSLLKSLPGTEDRQRAHVYMEGLAEMRREWKRGNSQA